MSTNQPAKPARAPAATAAPVAQPLPSAAVPYNLPPASVPEGGTCKVTPVQPSGAKAPDPSCVIEYRPT
jgi:hypothetical protein